MMVYNCMWYSVLLDSGSNIRDAFIVYGEEFIDMGGSWLGGTLYDSGGIGGSTLVDFVIW